MLKPVIIVANDIPDAWHQLILAAPGHARLFTIDRGSYKGQKRLEFDSIYVQIKYPGTRPFEPELPLSMKGVPNPVAEGYIEAYLPYLMTSTTSTQEQYTYGIYLEPQIQYVIDTYKKYSYRNNQLYMTVGDSKDITMTDPPCLRGIDCRIQDDKLHFHVYFRSHDLWSGFPANLGALEYLKEYMASEIGVDTGETIEISKGGHYYGYIVDLVCQRCRVDNNYEC